MLIERDGMHSREALAGYDRAAMSRGVVVVVGLGAAGCNIVQTTALSGVGEVRLVDHDVVEASNVTRSPLFRRDRLVPGRDRYKVREAALAVLALSTASGPRVRFATQRVEALGPGAFRGASVVISAVDSMETRAYLADVTRELRVPLVEVGFMGHEGHISVFPNASDEEACWRCLNPRTMHGRLSCRTYALAVVARGMIPATQPLAATFSGLAAEAAIGALHGRFELPGKLFGLDIRTGRSHVVEITRDPRCPGSHARTEAEVLVPVSAKQPLAALFEAVRPWAPEPLVHLPAEYVVSAPCVACGNDVSLQRPAWALSEAPRCRRGCATRPMLGGRGAVVVTTVRPGDELAARPCLSLGIAPGALVLVEDPVHRTSRVVQLQGDLDDLYVLRTRENTRDGEATVASDSADGPSRAEGSPT
ncbi:MAG: molybdopterin biosynthesis protein MoeB [Myxococcaceae bacterium]|nr:molybdopterin biosynthesis protein MoeB [Myxococcaceae bacterium]